MLRPARVELENALFFLFESGIRAARRDFFTLRARRWRPIEGFSFLEEVGVSACAKIAMARNFSRDRGFREIERGASPA